MSDELESVIQIQNESYVENYSQWQQCQEKTNAIVFRKFKIPNYLSYDNFCIRFNEAVIKYLSDPNISANGALTAEEIVYDLMLEKLFYDINYQNFLGKAFC